MDNRDSVTVGVIEIGKKNKNDRVYSQEICEKIVEDSRELIESGIMHVDAEAPTGGVISLGKLIGKVDDIFIEDGWVKAEISPVQTPIFKVLFYAGKLPWWKKALTFLGFFKNRELEQFKKTLKGGKLSVAPVGSGSIDGKGIVQDDYQLLGFFLTPEPSFVG